MYINNDDKDHRREVIRQLQPGYGTGYIEKILAKFPDYTFINTMEF